LGQRPHRLSGITKQDSQKWERGRSGNKRVVKVVKKTGIYLNLRLQVNLNLQGSFLFCLFLENNVEWRIEGDMARWLVADVSVRAIHSFIHSLYYIKI
jgi:hypothetical protein